jgi:hypothetical protein
MKSFMEYVQLKNEGLFDFFKSKKPASAPTGASTAPTGASTAPTGASTAPTGASDREKKRKPLDTYDPYTAKYSPLTRDGHSYVNYKRMSPDEIAAAEDQSDKNSIDAYYGKEKDPGMKALIDHGNPVDKFKKLEDDIKYGRFSYNTSNVPKMMLFMLNNHMDGSYMPFFGSLVKNNAVKMIPYDLALRTMELNFGSNSSMMALRSFLARHLMEKTPSKIQGLESLELIRKSLVSTDKWAKTILYTPDFLQHIKEEDIKDIWLKFFERRPDLAKKYYEKNGERMRLNQKYKQANDTRYQKPNDMENLIFSMFGEKNESFKSHKKSLFDW